MTWRTNLWFLAGGCMVTGTSYTMLIPFLPVYLYNLGVTGEAIHVWSGMIFSATFLVSALLSPYWGRRADKSGKMRMLVRSGLSLTVVYFLGALVESPLQLLGMRLLQGVATGFVPAALAIVASTAPEEEMGFSLGMMQAASLVGGIMGPLFGGVLSHVFGIRTSFVVASLVMLIATLALRALVKEPDRFEPPQKGGVVSDLKLGFENGVLREMLALTVVAQIIVMIAQPLIPIYVEELQGSLEGVYLTSGLVISAAGVAGAIAAPLWGRIGQNVGFDKILIWVFSGTGVAFVLQAAAGGVLVFGLLQFMFGFFIAGAMPMINTIATANTEADFRGRAFGLMMSAHQVGSMIGPLIGGLASSLVGIRMVFVFTGVLAASVAAVLWRRAAGAKTDAERSGGR